MSITLVITAIACLLLGGVIGFLVSRLSTPNQQRIRELENKLQQTENSLKNYQQEVTEHFIQTSGLINNLTQSYRAVHEHMASSAMQLATPDISRQLVNAGTGKLTDGSEPPLSETTPEPPKDYAPTPPGGVLSEEYGLNEHSDAPAHPGQAATTTDESEPSKAG